MSEHHEGEIPQKSSEGDKTPSEATEPSEAKKFHECIELDAALSSEEAIDVLCRFHGATSEAIKNAFSHLGTFTEGTIIFTDSVNHGYPCIAMKGLDTDGKRLWSHLIDKYTGQPQQRSG